MIEKKEMAVAVQTLGSQINILLFFGVGLVIIGLLCPSMFASAPWAPGGGVVLLTLNVHCYFRRLQKAMSSASETEKCEPVNGEGRR